MMLPNHPSKAFILADLYGLSTSLFTGIGDKLKQAKMHKPYNDAIFLDICKKLENSETEMRKVIHRIGWEAYKF